MIVKKYDKKDLEKMLILFRWIGPLYEEQQEFIYSMLRKYINATHWRPIITCGSCNMSYAVAFNKLRDWVSQNSDKFL